MKLREFADEYEDRVDKMLGQGSTVVREARKIIADIRKAPKDKQEAEIPEKLEKKLIESIEILDEEYRKHVEEIADLEKSPERKIAEAYNK